MPPENPWLPSELYLGCRIFIPVIFHYQLRFAANRYIVDLVAKGEPMELAQVIPSPVSREQNAAPLIMGALTNLYEKYNCIGQNQSATNDA